MSTENWVTDVVGKGGGDDGSSFFVYIIQRDTQNDSKMRMKVTQNGMEVHSTASASADVFRMLTSNDNGMHQPLLVEGRKSVRPPNAQPLPLLDDDGSDPSGTRALRTAYWTTHRLIKQIQQWKEETNSRITKINLIISEMNSLPT
eukprot:576667-Rhodomonas_salina.1